MPVGIDYVVPGPLTVLSGIDPAVLAGLPDDSVGICRPVAGLVVQPVEARTLGVAEDRFAENQLRPAAALLDALLAQDPAPLMLPRPAPRRVVGTCRHFAVVAW